MECRSCHNDLIQEQIPGFGVRFICVEPDCPLGRHRRLDRDRQVPLDGGRVQMRGRIKKLLAKAASSEFQGEKEVFEAMAGRLATKHGL